MVARGAGWRVAGVDGRAMKLAELGADARCVEPLLVGEKPNRGG
jgi:hypothetical protein